MKIRGAGKLNKFKMIFTVLAKPQEFLEEKVANIGKGRGLIKTDDVNTSPEAEQFYRTISDRQTPPASYDARALSKKLLT